MSDDLGARLQEAEAVIDGGIALIDKLQRGIIEFEARSKAENEGLRARIVELEAELALLRGSPGSSPASETLTEYTHDVPASAPR